MLYDSDLFYTFFGCLSFFASAATVYAIVFQMHLLDGFTNKSGTEQLE